MDRKSVLLETPPKEQSQTMTMKLDNMTDKYLDNHYSITLQFGVHGVQDRGLSEIQRIRRTTKDNDNKDHWTAKLLLTELNYLQ